MAEKPRTLTREGTSFPEKTIPDLGVSQCFRVGVLLACRAVPFTGVAATQKKPAALPITATATGAPTDSQRPLACF